MVNGSGVLGWGVGGIEAEAVMLGQPISMVIPEVIGCELVGCLADTVTTTDLVLTITESLRVFGVVGKFVEFFGEGVASLSIADRATIANMCPEYGATVGFFPVDWRTVQFGCDSYGYAVIAYQHEIPKRCVFCYLLQSGRDESYCNRVENYLKANRMFVEYGDSQCKPTFTKILTFDLRLIVPSLSGPRRPQDRIDLSSLHKDFSSNLTTKFPFKGFGLRAEHLQKGTSIIKNGSIGNLTHGSVVIAAITSCTNTSNPSVMLAAGLVAKKVGVLILLNSVAILPIEIV
ncbi:aconitase family protein [Necator americanus]|uniref:Aconitase family protein n=1 Tax=Necator americanus TaxID=51031 RepID=W2TGW1_NECAM|nr:aconitase family protein [Necator americanus]ETN81083.1 aconitase family protein [Necator americanus]